MKYAELYSSLQSAVIIPAKEAFVTQQYSTLGSFKQFQPAPNKHVNALLTAWNVNVQHDIKDGAAPHFSPVLKALVIPPPAAFKRPEIYTYVLLHELSHWTRLLTHRYEDVETNPPRGVEDIIRYMAGQPPMYWIGREELLAERTAQLLASRIAPEVPEDGFRSYMHAWIRNMRDAYGESEEEFVQSIFDEAMTVAEENTRFLLSRLEKTA